MTDILIRRAEPTDAEDIVRIFQAPRVVWGTLQLPYPSLAFWRPRLEPRDDFYLYVACTDARHGGTQQVVGQLGLETNSKRPRRKHVGSLGMAVRDDWQGKGVGTALMQVGVEVADRWLNLTRLELEVFTDNEPAIRLYKKFGFEIEGTLKQQAFRDGKYVDAYFMARLRTFEL
jgi:putative acetyltransferase